MLIENYNFPYKGLDTMAKRYKTNVLGLYLGPFLSIVACDDKSVREALLHPDLQGRPDTFVPRLRCCGERLGKLVLFEFVNTQCIYKNKHTHPYTYFFKFFICMIC